MSKQITVAVDGSQHAMIAVGMAAQIAQRTGAKLEAVFVEEPHGLLDAVRRSAPPISLEKARAALEKTHPGLDLRILRGKLEPELIMLSRDVDLLALGAAGVRHERAGDRSHIDVRVKRIVLNAHAPTLIAPANPLSIERIRLAYSAPSGKSISAAVDFAVATGWPLEVSLLPDDDASTDEGERSIHALDVLRDHGIADVPIAYARGENLLEGLRACGTPGDILVLSGEDFDSLGHEVAALGLPVIAVPQ
jgi:Universal stress protein family